MEMVSVILFDDLSLTKLPSRYNSIFVISLVLPASATTLTLLSSTREVSPGSLMLTTISSEPEATSVGG